MYRYISHLLVFVLTFTVSFGFVLHNAGSQSIKSEKPSKAEAQNKPNIRTEMPKSTEDNYEKVSEKLDIYLAGSEIEPAILINNISGNRKRIKIGSHDIQWIDKDKEDISLKIDDDLFTINRYETLNKVWDGKDQVNYFNEWEQIVLYEINGRELIGINLDFNMCNGLGCGVSYYLIYDVKTKNKNFFGTYCMDDGLKLYDFGHDETVDYLGKTFVGDRCTLPDLNSENIYNLFTLNDNGNFELQSDEFHYPYFIKQMFWVEDHKGIDEIFEHNWIETIDIE